MNEYKAKVRLPSNRVTDTRIWADTVTTAQELLEAMGMTVVTSPAIIQSESTDG